jgi:hypothetical protein
MLGPGPAILFWTPIALLVLVVAVGFGVYQFSMIQKTQ